MLPDKDYEIMIFKAERDYKSGILLSKSELEDQAVYHFQQAGEKALKAYLMFENSKIPKTHDLTMLIDICVEIDKNFEQFYEKAENLTPYSTAFRYMDIGLGLIPDAELIREAEQDSKDILEFVKSKFKEKK